MNNRKEKTINNTRLALFLRVAAVLVGMMGLTALIASVPGVGVTSPEFNGFWRGCLWILAIPCYWALILFWKVVTNIGADRSFCMENVRYMKRIALLAAVDTLLTLICGVISIGNLPGIATVALIGIAVMGFGITAASGALAYLVDKARLIEEENDFTI